MSKQLLSVVAASFLVGSAVQVFLLNPPGVNLLQPMGPQQSSPFNAASPPGSRRSDEGRRGLFTRRLTALNNLAQADELDLEERISQLLLAGLNSIHVDHDVEWLFARLFELNPRRALALVQAESMPYRLQSAVFRRWAQIDQEQATAFLRELADPRSERLLALAILGVNGYELDLVPTLVASGRTLDVSGLKIAALKEVALTNPSAALEEVQDLPGFRAKKAAYMEIARVATGHAEVASFAESIEDSGTYSSLQSSFLRELYKQWSRTDTEGFLAHVSTLDPLDPALQGQLSHALHFAMESDPAQALRFADNLESGPLAEFATRTAVEELATVDPEAAIDRLGFLPEGRERDHMLVVLTKGYAQKDLEEVLNWYSTLDDIDGPLAQVSIAEALAESDLARAIDFEIESGGGPVSAFPAWLDIPWGNDLSNPALVANKLVSENAENLLALTLRRWAVTDSQSAMAWIQAQEELPTLAVRFVAGELGGRDFSQAIRFSQSLPPDQRAESVQAAALQAALFDPAGAIEASGLLQDRSLADDVNVIITGSVAQHHGPQTAADLVGAAPSVSVARTIARSWTNLDPAAAAQWASSLGETEVREQALELICTSAMVPNYCD